MAFSFNVAIISLWLSNHNVYFRPPCTKTRSGVRSVISVTQSSIQITFEHIVRMVIEWDTRPTVLLSRCPLNVLAVELAQK